MKAYCVCYGNELGGGILVFAHNRNEARTIGFKKGPWMADDYIYMKARRVPGFDKYAKMDTPYFVDSNDQLPVPFFSEEKEE